MGRRGAVVINAIAALGAVTATAAAGAPVAGAVATGPPVAHVYLRAIPFHVRRGRAVRLSGRVADPLGGRSVFLYESRWPYPVAHRIASAIAAADGRFSFTVRPDRNTRYRVSLAGSGARAVLQIGVAYEVRTVLTPLPLGRVRVTIVAYHPHDLLWGGARVAWSLASGRSGRFVPMPASRTREARRGATVLSTTFALPAGRFHFRACFRARGYGAVLDDGRPPACRARGYAGAGVAPYGFPSPAAVIAAAAYLGGRAGRTAFAVVDSEGRLSGVHVHWTFVSASVVKAMLLVSYLRMLDAQGQRRIDGYSNSFLYPMINVSDNSAATQTWSIVGEGRLYALAAAAGMTDFSVSGFWANAQISAGDQARFFFELDSLIPREFVGYARYLLSTIVGYESWGVAAVARGHRYAVFFKGGWRGTALGQLVHQVARLERPDHSFAIAVMTDADPSMGYGIGTIEGLTGALLGNGR
jgi:hypothetical protein